MLKNFELNDDLIKTIRAYLCFTCLLWVRPIYISFNKKINLPVKENDTDEKKTENKNPGDIIVLTRQFQQLFNNYLHDLMDSETSDYFTAKKEIERIDKLLTSTVCNGGKVLIFFHSYLNFNFFVLYLYVIQIQ